MQPGSDPSARDLHAKARAEHCDGIDRQLGPLGLEAIRALGPLAGRSVLDIGCGAGPTLLQLAQAVGPRGQVAGVDIAAPLLAIARHRTQEYRNVRCIEANAQTLKEPSASSGAVFSRFGVMGFDDPVAAFANVRRILRPSGTLAFCCWRPLQENELDRFPLHAAGLPPPADDSPFSLADPARVRSVLSAAGFSQIDIRPHDQQVSCGDLDATVPVLLATGPLGKIVRQNPSLRPSLEPPIRSALAARGNAGAVTLTASTWIVTARG